jgi:copper homeostasis protein
MSVTFHRAFDRCNDPFKALEEIIACGCERILTSGLKPTAMEGASLISELIIKADNRIIIMPGSGIRSENITELHHQTGATEFHSSARKFVPSKMNFLPPSMNEPMKSVQLDQVEVASIVNKLTACFSEK